MPPWYEPCFLRWKRKPDAIKCSTSFPRHLRIRSPYFPYPDRHGSRTRAGRACLFGSRALRGQSEIHRSQLSSGRRRKPGSLQTLAGRDIIISICVLIGIFRTGSPRGSESVPPIYGARTGWTACEVIGATRFSERLPAGITRAVLFGTAGTSRRRRNSIVGFPSFTASFRDTLRSSRTVSAYERISRRPSPPANTGTGLGRRTSLLHERFDDFLVAGLGKFLSRARVGLQDRQLQQGALSRDAIVFGEHRLLGLGYVFLHPELHSSG